MTCHQSLIWDSLVDLDFTTLPSWDQGDLSKLNLLTSSRIGDAICTFAIFLQAKKALFKHASYQRQLIINSYRFQINIIIRP